MAKRNGKTRTFRIKLSGEVAESFEDVQRLWKEKNCPVNEGISYFCNKYMVQQAGMLRTRQYLLNFRKNNEMSTDEAIQWEQLMDELNADMESNFDEMLEDQNKQWGYGAINN